MSIQSTHRGEIRVQLVPRTERQRSSDDIAMQLRRQLAGLPGVQLRARSTGSHMMRMISGDQDSRLTVEIRGHDIDTARRLANEVKALLDTTPGIADTRLSQDLGRPELAVRVDRDKAALLGMTVTSVANTIRTNVAGTQAAFFRQHGYEYPIVVRLREEDRHEIKAIGDVLIDTPQGKVLPVKNVMIMDRDTGPVQVERLNQERIMRVNAETETSLSDAVGAIQARLTAIRLPADFSIGFGNEVEEQARSFRQLQMVLILAIVLVYTVMASQYESLRDPFIIMMSVPLSLAGAMVFLFLGAATLNIYTQVGLITLVGLITKHGILIVAFANNMQEQGCSVREAVEHAAGVRLRPILMTTAAMVLGVLPLLIAHGPGAEARFSMGLVIAAGMAIGTCFTLFVVPAFYVLVAHQRVPVQATGAPVTAAAPHA